ncbi:hypothetical protein [Salipiger abyssi]|uniref:Flagellar motor rotation protein MotB n=1 Tax=Salipiger abyssi TaxID=1250539 RepID=A0A1P8V0K6_9RHOB|nr:hypothetical protein [Salipiger abyssi]APZ55183.1 Flagellar motor rotation protein MotB [Salipiger abyssi]
MAVSPDDAPFGSILHLGSGPLLDLADCKARTDTQIAIVEADPARVRDLERQTGDAAHIRILHAALAAEDGEADLRVFNIPALSSTADPTGLQELYPGFRILRRPSVPAMTAQSLIDSLAPLPEPRRLVLDAPGADAGFLAALQALDLLAGFSRIDIRTSQEALFADGQTMAALSEQLTGQGFTVLETDLSDPDWPVRRFGIDRQARAAAALEQQLAEQREHVAALEAAAAKRDKDVDTLETALKDLTATADWRAKRIKELEEDAARAAKEAKTRIDTLETSLRDLTATADARAKRIKELEAGATETAQTLADREQALKDLTATADWRSNRIKELEDDAARTAKEAEGREAALAARIDELTGDAEARATRIAELEAAAVTAAAETETRETALTAQIDELTQTAETRTKRIAELEAAASDRQKRLDTLEAEHRTLTETAETRAKRIKELEQKATETAKTLADREQSLKDLTATADWRAKRIKEIEDEASRAAKDAETREQTLGDKIAALEKQAQQREAQYRQGKTDLSLALRMQTICGNDLRDLQQSHAALQEQKAQQDRLIALLAARLEDASQHLKALSLTEPPAQETGTAPQIPEERKTAPKRKSAAKRKPATRAKKAK